MDETGPLTTDQVLDAERAALRPNGGGAPFRALCISGGGIRSATFALGALQRLAEHGLLSQFDYMSTVSGGGYIGGWLTAWIQRVGGLDRVLPGLVPNATAPPGAPDPVAHLREYNNYLTPKLGALSPDTWTLAVTVARNVLLNWLVFIPLLLCALMIPRLFFSLHVVAHSAFLFFFPWLAGAFLTWSLWNVLRYLPGVGGKDHTVGDFLRFVLLPLLIAGLMLCGYEANVDLSLWPTVIGALVPCLAAWTGFVLTRGKGARARNQRRELGALLGAVLMLGAGLGVAAWVLQSDIFVIDWARLVTFGLPLLLIAFSLAGAVFVGLSSHILGTQDREWLARADAYVMQVVAVWMASGLVVLLAPDWILDHPWKKWMMAALAAASAWASSQFGYHAPVGPQSSTAPQPSAVRRWCLKLAPPLFLVALALSLTLLTDWMLLATGTVDLHADGVVADPSGNHSLVAALTGFKGSVLWTLGFAALAWIMARYININKFSLQGMYRDRLIRAYLRASNPNTKANKFTGFDSSDDLALHCLDPQLRPLQVVNMTLNLVAAENLAWQQRKAEPFTASALHCGSPRLGYRPSKGYGGSEGITLGTAVAISGAAASPNMGYHSSPLVGFIMTLFNLRLGSWLGNPGPAGEKTWSEAGPRSAIRALLREALGQTVDHSDYVYLSDGGHFENLGLYEMIRRRCQTIVVLDGGCDPDFTFEDLGNALRKIRIDLKVPISFSAELRDPNVPLRKRRCAVARIGYSQVDSACADGHLIYIKPVLLGDEPPDVASYAAAHPTFPHQSTSEQWFDESQTESYRMLGVFTVADICRNFEGRTLEELAMHVAGPAAVAVPLAAAIPSSPLPAGAPVPVAPAAMPA